MEGKVGSGAVGIYKRAPEGEASLPAVTSGQGNDVARSPAGEDESIFRVADVGHILADTQLPDIIRCYTLGSVMDT